MAVWNEKANEVFLSAIEIESDAERTAYLEQACGADAELRASVETLLSAHAAAGTFLGSPAVAVAATTTGPDLDPPLMFTPPGTVIGRYKVLEPIGEGGYGTVFMAEQTTPVQRRVALKIIKPGMDTKQVIARFEAERQALALMDHPSIAKVFDAGVTETGRPYFVMELVKGTPITRYCDEHKLTPKQRLELFVQVCQAVQHAHQKGIIHRDLKPTNVLVAQYDGKPVPKVIDFGVAKATGQRLTEATMFTGFGDVIGTPQYMSPEQAELNQLDVDTRSDIYSLGVLLYELLTGTTPLQANRVKEAALLEVLRVVREEEPPRPSVRLTTTEQLPMIAAQRGLDPRKLATALHGELDWIVMKALEKDRARRYETANGLAMDVERYLRDESVQACPPSTAYRFRKFARRNKAALVTAALVGTALMLGTVISTWQAVRATRAERVAEAETQKARTEAAIARAVNEFVNNGLLAQAQPHVAYGDYQQPEADLKLRTVLDRAAANIQGRFEDQPLVEAALRHTIGSTYSQLNPAAADPHLRRAIELRRAHLGEEHPDTLASLNALALLTFDEALFTRVLAGRRRVLGNEHRHTLHALYDIALAARNRGDVARAVALLRETLAVQQRVLGEDHLDSAWTMHSLAHTLADWLPREPAQDAQIEQFYRHALAIYRAKMGDRFWRTTDITFRLGRFLHTRGRYADAEQVLRDGYERLRAQAAVPPRWVAELARELGGVYRSWGDAQQAAEWERKVADHLTDTTRLQPDDHGAHYALGSGYAFRGQWADARPAFQRAAELSPADLWSLYRWATLCVYTGDRESYRLACRRMLDQFEQTSSLLNADCTAKACSLGLEFAGDATQIAKLADFIMRGTEDHAARGWYEVTRGLVDYRAGRFAAAAEMITRCAPSSDGLQRDALAFSILAMAQHRLGQGDAARSALADAQRILSTKMPDPTNGQTFGDDWHDWLHAQLLCREAEGLLKTTTQPSR